MNVVEELETLLTLDQAEGLADSDPTPVTERGVSTQQLLDELLGRFDDDDSLMFSTLDLRPELHSDSDK
jgi:hypothetical protein